jgi:predicted acetyltransferase
MINEQVALVEPSPDLMSELLSMAEEYQSASDNRYQAVIEDSAAFIRKLELYSKGIDLPSGFVSTTTFFLLSNNRIIGRSSLRHRLTAELANEGGHIGYDIRPSERRKGYGTLILKLMLNNARSMGLDRVLVTCDVDNVASARIIQKNGGKLHGQSISKRTAKAVSQYWIEL